jgi:hypothetical protein
MRNPVWPIWSEWGRRVADRVDLADRGGPCRRSEIIESRVGGHVREAHAVFAEARGGSFGP